MFKKNCKFDSVCLNWICGLTDWKSSQTTLTKSEELLCVEQTLFYFVNDAKSMCCWSSFISYLREDLKFFFWCLFVECLVLHLHLFFFEENEQRFSFIFGLTNNPLKVFFQNVRPQNWYVLVSHVCSRTEFSSPVRPLRYWGMAEWPRGVVCTHIAFLGMSSHTKVLKDKWRRKWFFEPLNEFWLGFATLNF